MNPEAIRSRRAGAGLLALALALALPAPTNAAHARPIRFEQLSLEQGLSQSTVMRVLQDSRGYVWLATEDGLNRYDGLSFSVFRQERADAASLPSSLVWDLDEDAAGDLWIGTSAGLATWQRRSGAIVRHPLFAQQGVRAVRFDPRAARLWVGTRDRGLCVLDPASSGLERHTHDPTKAGSLADDRVYALLVDAQHRLWVGTEAGLDRLDPGTDTFVHVLPAPAAADAIKVRAIVEDSEGAIWVGTSASGLLRVAADGAVTRFRHDAQDPNSLAHDQVRALLRDSEQRLWVGTGAGLDLFDRDSSGFVHYRGDPTSPGALRDDKVTALAQDRGGVLWVGTRLAGVHKWNPRSWQFGHVAPAPQDPRGLASGHVTSFSEDASGRLWIGTFGAGLALMQRDSGDVRSFRRDPADPRSLGSDRVMALYHARDGGLWVGTLDAGLDRYDPALGFVHHRSGKGGLSADGVTALLEDRDGALWIGTYGGGLDRYDPAARSFTNYRNDPADEHSLNGDRIAALAEAADGGLWVGTMEKGLALLDRQAGRFRRFRHQPDDPGSLPSDVVHALFVDSAGGLWAGTHAGLAHLAPQASAFETFTSRDGLSNDVVYGVRADSRGRLWLSTNNGLSCFDPRSREVVRYGAADGLQDAEFNFGAWYQSPAGELFFGGLNGFNAFYPERLRGSASDPAVVLTRVIVDHDALPGPADQLRSVDLGYRDRVLGLEFAALDFTAPQRNRFSYRLAGFDPNWVPLASGQRVTYTNLDAGEYTFELRGATPDGRWSESPLRLRVHVQPAPWRSRWALLGYALMLGGGAFGFVRLQQRRVEKEAENARRLEGCVQERTRELCDRQASLEKLNEELAHASVTDELTGLANRRFLTDYLERETALLQRRLDREQEAGETLAEFGFVMVDLDSFKMINDTSGHGAGDAVLRRFRDVLLSLSRTSDVVVRWGGDEFLLIARDISVRGLAELAERIRETCARTPYGVGSGFVVHTTCSVGWAPYPFFPEQPDALSWEQVLSLADRALLVAKSSGRDAWIGFHAGAASPPDHAFDLSEDGVIELVDDGTMQVATLLHGARPLVWRARDAAPERRGQRLAPLALEESC